MVPSRSGTLGRRRRPLLCSRMVGATPADMAARSFCTDVHADTTTIPILSLDVNNSAGLIAAGTEHPEFTHTGGDVLVWYAPPHVGYIFAAQH